MRLASILVAALASAAPVALAEQWEPRAAGMTLGFENGVTGLQFGEQNGVGVRYWRNSTETGDSTTLVLTTCYTSGSSTVVYCERHWLTS